LDNNPTTQFFEQGIMANFLFVQARTNWICEGAIKIKDVYYYYLGWSNVDTEQFDKNLSLAECYHQASNTRTKLKDAVDGTSYELEVATTRANKRFPDLFENLVLEQERDDLIEKELKSCENRRSAQRSFKKLGG
jgi:hypothetical protein